MNAYIAINFNSVMSGRFIFVNYFIMLLQAILKIYSFKCIVMHIFQFILYLPPFSHLIILIFLFLLSLVHRVLIKVVSWAWNMLVK